MNVLGQKGIHKRKPKATAEEGVSDPRLTQPKDANLYRMARTRKVQPRRRRLPSAVARRQRMTTRLNLLPRRRRRRRRRGRRWPLREDRPMRRLRKLHRKP